MPVTYYRQNIMYNYEVNSYSKTYLINKVYIVGIGLVTHDKY